MVSSCLAGIDCKYSGGNNKSEKIYRMVMEGKAIPVCPEVMGGMPIPRTPCEIVINDKGEKRIMTAAGEDFTEEFTSGAEKTLEIAKILDIDTAIFQPRSPSCGCGTIYSGKFEGKLITGNGFTADLLLRNGIKVCTPDDYFNDNH